MKIASKLLLALMLSLMSLGIAVAQEPGAVVTGGGSLGTQPAVTTNGPGSGRASVAGSVTGVCSWYTQSTATTEIFNCPISIFEQPAPLGILGSDVLFADSIAHRWKMINNNGLATQVVASGADIDTSDKVQKINGVSQIYQWPAQKFNSGKYYDNLTIPGFGNSIFGANGDQYFEPFYVATTNTFDRIAVTVTTGGAAGCVLRLGIYNDTGNETPGSVLLDAGTVACTGTGTTQITISQVLTPGMYWVSVAQQGAPASRATVAGSFADTIGIPMDSPGTGSHGAYFQGGTTGAFATASGFSVTAFAIRISLRAL